MTNAGSLIAYLQSQWGTAIAPGTASMHFDHEWFNADYIDVPQIVVTELTNPDQETWKTGNTFYHRHAPRLQVQVGCLIPVASEGTQEAEWVEAMKHEIHRITVAGLEMSPSYGGSLGAYRVALTDELGRLVSPNMFEPRMIRYVLDLRCTEDT